MRNHLANSAAKEAAREQYGDFARLCTECGMHQSWLSKLCYELKSMKPNVSALPSFSSPLFPVLAALSPPLVLLSTAAARFTSESSLENTDLRFCSRLLSPLAFASSKVGSIAKFISESSRLNIPPNEAMDDIRCVKADDWTLLLELVDDDADEPLTEITAAAAEDAIDIAGALGAEVEATLLLEAAVKASFNWFRLLSMDMPSSLGSRN